MSSETATLAGGCFWCTEALFKMLKGVVSVTSGYSGGTVENPTYEQVSSGTTGHAEVVQIVFDPNVVSFEKILDVFFHTHDPTTQNRQGSDVGTQYRSEVFYHSDEQRQVAEAYIKELDDSKYFGAKIVTKVTPFTKFYIAESYHMDYYKNHPNQPYCNIVIDPKVKKLVELYGEDVKKESKQ